MIRQFRRLLLIYLATMQIASAAPCDELRKILADGGHFFVGLRGNYDFTLNHYEGQVQVGEFSLCRTESGNGVSTYSCTEDIREDNEELAKVAWAHGKEYLNACLGTDLKDEHSHVDHYAFFTFMPSNTGITVGYHRLVSALHGPHYLITIEFVEVDRSIPKGEES